jgi:NAD(P)-dependent dehydrogenase (short-subunit alcohol dehydrogenase family)
VLPLQMDMTQLDQISRAVGDTAAHFGRLDLLVIMRGWLRRTWRRMCARKILI